MRSRCRNWFVIGLWLVNFLGIGLPLGAFAESGPYTSMNAPEEAPRNTVLAAFAMNYFDYAESVDPPKKSTETGTLPVLRLGYEHRFDKGWGMSTMLDTSIGNTTYDGSTQSGTPITFNNSPNTIFNFEALGSKILDDSGAGRLKVYGGFGVHYWARGNGKLGPGDYREHYLWVYLPVGIQYLVVKNSFLEMGPDFSFHLNTGGFVKAYLSDTGSSEADLTLPLGPALGARFQFPINLRFASWVQLRFLPYVWYMTIGQGSSQTIYDSSGSATNYSAREPASRTWLIGGFVGPAFSF